MPSLSTLSDLQSALDAELAWRKKEIVALRKAATRAHVAREYYCRAGSVMLCAHWEGFLRGAIRAYVEHVFAQNLSLAQLKPQFVAIHFFDTVKLAAEAGFPGSERHHMRLAKKIVSSTTGPCRTPGWRVNTNGNPSSSLCSELLKSVALDPMLGYDEARWSVAKVFIDTQVLKDRHKVAHGERFPVEHAQFSERSTRMIRMCEDLSDLVMVAAAGREYQLQD